MNASKPGHVPGFLFVLLGPLFDNPGSIRYPGVMKEIVRYRRCFVCGDENEHGLKARFFDDGDQAITDLVTEPAFEGYRGIFHGGIISTLLDEVMIKAILARDVLAVTAEMTVRFRQPLGIGVKLRLAGRIVRVKGRVYVTEGEAVGEDGTVYATAKGRYVAAPSELRSRLAESIDPG